MSRRLAVLFFLLVGFVTACGSGGAISLPAGAPEESVHRCDSPSNATPDPMGIQPSQLQAVARQTPTVVPSATPAPRNTEAILSKVTPVKAGDGCTGPDFSQKCALWGNEEYDHGKSQDVGCGTTIAQCGCAMTSAASLLAHHGVTRGPDGLPLTPKSLNDYLRGDARTTSAGTVSRGYVYGGVNWLAVAAYSAQAATKFGTPSVAYAGHLGGGDFSGLQKELERKRPVVLEEKGHFILATSPASSTAVINDPFYLERRTLDVPSYRNTFLSGRLYKSDSDVSAIMVAAPKGVEFTVTDAKGAATGQKPGTQVVISEVRQSSFAIEAAWRDPTCTAGSPRSDLGVSEAVLLQPVAGRYIIDVSGANYTGGKRGKSVTAAQGEFEIAVYAYDQAGNLTLKTFEGVGSGQYVIDYNPAPASEQKVEPTIGPGTATPTPLPGSQPATPQPEPPVAPTPERAAPGPVTATPAPQLPVVVPPEATVAPPIAATPVPTITATRTPALPPVATPRPPTPFVPPPPIATPRPPTPRPCTPRPGIGC